MHDAFWRARCLQSRRLRCGSVCAVPRLPLAALMLRSYELLMSIHRHLPLLSIVVLVGCGASASTLPPAATAANAKRELIAQPCPQLPGNQEAGEGGYRRVFIQAAQVLTSDLRQPLDGWLIDHPVGISSVVSFMGDKDVPTTVSWNRCLDEACAGSEPWKMTVTPALPARASEPLQLTVALRRDQDSEDSVQSAKLETRNQEPVVVDQGGAADRDPWSLVVTPYLIGNDEDLRRLGQCKASAASPDP